jgi:uncharacterized membrane protein
MGWLLLGLVLFLGVHSVRIVAEDWRTATRARLGAGAWKGLYSLLSVVGFVLIVWGFAQARQQPVAVWSPPTGLRHLASLLTLVAFVLLAAAYVPGNGIRARMHHPMILGVKTWALAHLLANGTLAHMVLFGSFMAWAVLDYRAARQRDRAAATAYPAGHAIGTALTVAMGVLAWAVFAFWLHGWWIGVRPIGSGG